MNPRPFLIRLILPFAVVMSLLLLVCGAVIYWAERQATERQQVRDLDRLTNLVRPWVAGDTSLSQEQLEKLRGAADVLGTRITLIDGRGNVVFDTHATPERMQNHNDRPEVVAARQGRFASDVRKSATLNDSAVYVARLVNAADRDGQVLRLSYLHHSYDVISAPIWLILGGSLAAALLLIALLAWILQRQWIAPTQRLAHAAERMTRGHWDTRAETGGADDLRFFASRLNLLAAHAQKQLADLNAQRSDLRALVDTLPDPILVTDASRRIVLLNAPAARLFQLSQDKALGQKIVSVVSDEAILQLVEHPDPSVQRDVRLTRSGQRFTYHAFATRTADGGTLLVLRDVTTLAATVQMKTDFVANASHELRTPIAAIKIAFETLGDVLHDDPEQADRCIHVVAEHLRRLEEMLADLLDLARVENPELKPSLTPVKPGELLSLVHSTMAPMASRKSVTLVLDESRFLADFFRSDPRLLNLVLKNLVENAIKFTPPGGRVTVSISRPVGEQQPVTLAVSDTGIGIAPQHLDRVFERFYQVDPARSGSSGRGTGLGLAIVKHALVALNGTIQLESTPGKGTTVTCTVADRTTPAPVQVAPSAA